MSTIRKVIGRILAAITSKLLNLLGDKRRKIDFTRDEFYRLNFTFSQFGEDCAILERLRHLNPITGIYVDVGAYDPICLSNTLLLHKLGWHGINIDLSDAAIRAFERYRPDDDNVLAAVSNQCRTMKKITYGNSELNRLISPDDDNLAWCGNSPTSTELVTTCTLNDILARSRFQGSLIHYLNIDCEGHDIQVLQGLDLARYAPALITIEALDARKRDQIAGYLKPYGYTVSDLLNITMFFTRADA